MMAPPELFLVDRCAPHLHHAIRRAHPRSRVFLWYDDAVAPFLLPNSAGQMLIAQGDLVERVARASGITPTPLADFDNRLDKSLRVDARRAIDRNGKAGTVLFCPSNDTHSHMFHPISKHIEDHRFLLADVRPGENAEATLEGLGIKPIIGGVEMLDQIRPAVIIVGNDWNATMKKLIAAARKRRIPTVCLQEGCLDFDTQRRMAWSDFPFIQGPIMPLYLDRPAYLPTGNPRFDAITPHPLPPRPVVMINCNFTYNVHEDQRESWVRAVARACQNLGIEFFVSQHPRDTGVFPDLPVRRSGAGVVHQHLADSSILVTRFSTLVYEALCMGRQCLYYNPFGEQMRLFNEDSTGGVLKVFSEPGLTAALEQAVGYEDEARRAAVARFLDLHCGPRDGAAARRSAAALGFLARNASPLPRRPLLSLLGL